METTDNITKQYVNGCGIIEIKEDGVRTSVFIRVMTADEVLERQELNVANTTQAVRQRVIAHNAKTNGH